MGIRKEDKVEPDSQSKGPKGWSGKGTVPRYSKLMYSRTPGHGTDQKGSDSGLRSEWYASWDLI